MFAATLRRGGCGIALCFWLAVRLTRIPSRGFDCDLDSLFLTRFATGYGQVVLDLCLPVCLLHCRRVHKSKPMQAELRRRACC